MIPDINLVLEAYIVTMRYALAVEEGLTPDQRRQRAETQQKFADFFLTLFATWNLKPE